MAYLRVTHIFNFNASYRISKNMTYIHGSLPIQTSIQEQDFFHSLCDFLLSTSCNASVTSLLPPPASSSMLPLRCVVLLFSWQYMKHKLFCIVVCPSHLLSVWHCECYTSLLCLLETKIWEEKGTKEPPLNVSLSRKNLIFLNQGFLLVENLNSSSSCLEKYKDRVAKTDTQTLKYQKVYVICTKKSLCLWNKNLSFFGAFTFSSGCLTLVALMVQQLTHLILWFSKTSYS